ncbi:MAG: hypothetical protein ACI9AU_001310 [Bacteroidia bacterium]|jgi:hypothetical protein
MKGICIFSLLLLFGFGTTTNETEDASVPNLNWLVGDWIRTNGDPGENTHENWTKTEDRYSGNASTIIKGDTVFQETIKANLAGKQWHYEVSGPNEEPVTFTSSSVTDSSFICENPTKEFPQTISYSKDGDCINAIISNGGDDAILSRDEKIAN